MFFFMFNGDFFFLYIIFHYISLNLKQRVLSYFTATLLLFDNLMFRGKSLK